MDPRTMRIMKEGRAMFWPWCAVSFAGLLPWLLSLPGFSPRSLEHGVAPLLTAASVVGFWVGIPLLATLPLGNEFQHRTLPLLLSQPIERLELWAEKWSVTVIAVLSASLVYCFGWHRALDENPWIWGFGS